MVLVPHAVRTIPCTLGVRHQTKQLGFIPFYKPKNNKTMKRKFVFFCAAMAAVCVGCSSENEERNVSEPTEVTLMFSPYTMEAMTRAATSIASVVTRLDVWVTEGGNTTAVHQSSADADFGTVSLTLDKTKTYTLVAIGHKSTGAATLTDGIIAFPDDRVTHSMIYTTTFTPATTTSLNCIMQRIVAAFRMETTDAVPSACKKLRFTTSGVFDRWNVTTGATHGLDRTTDVSITSTAQDGTVAVTIYNIVTDAQTLHTVTVETLDANDDVIQQRVFADVPMRNGYRTTYRGTFFTDTPMTMTFAVDDWNDYDVVNF